MIVSGEPLLSPWQLLRSVAARRDAGLAAVSARLGGRLRLFELGRHALAEALRGLVPPGRQGGQLAVPAYICDTVIDGIRAAGWRWRYYPLREGGELAPDWDWLEAHPDDADDALLLVHYFGFPSDLDGAGRFARRRGLALIEDCAHAFFTAAMNADVGRTARAAVYSWRKFFPLANGGGLMRSAQAESSPGPMRAGRTGGAAALRQLANWLMFKSGSRCVLRRLGPTISDEPERTMDDAAAPAPPDGFAARLLAAEAPRLERIARRRCDNYRRLHDGLGGPAGAANLAVPLTPPLTPPLTTGAVPWCLPLEVRGSGTGGSLIEHLLSSGIGAWPWPALPGDVTVDAFPREFRLAGSTVCLPVHQSLDRRHIRRIASAVLAWRG